MSKHFKLIIPDEGADVYRPRIGQSWGYRYGPSIMIHDGICEAWFASPGDGYEADWFTYRRSDDNGESWTEERVVMAPTPNSMDWFSVCDPAVIKYGEYYYIGYTSTIFSHGGGVCNNAFVARSKSPTGPFYKWTGNGWGEKRQTEHGELLWIGDPAPIVYFDESWRCWGAGELSFVIKDDLLYIYYTWTSALTDGRLDHSTRVALADITREDWPSTIKFTDGIIRKPLGNDSFDVVYCEDIDKFVALSTDRRFSEDSMLAVYESEDGVHFERVNDIRKNTAHMCHNCGISGDCHHHIRSGDVMLLGYAYGNIWGNWGTKFHRYDFEAMDENYHSELGCENVKGDLTRWTPEEKMSKTYLSLQHPHYINLHVGSNAQIELLLFDVMYNTVPALDGVTFFNYDRSIIEIEGMTVRGVGQGYTFVSAKWGDLFCEFLVRVENVGYIFDDPEKRLVSLSSVTPQWHPSLSRKNCVQIRGLAKYSDGTFFEICEACDGVTYENLSPDILDVCEENGCIFPKKIGHGRVKVRCQDLEFIAYIEVEK